ncbi:MAG TPA: NAD(P)/FAD-dependent oxidoreductase [archaeon]|jgi:geranylgeranyl reductase family protein|nr:NAD(P)/FAD-dependent oxidoreductase [archaeon]
MIKGLETKIVVVGGGPAGLYCAYLIKRFNPSILVTLIESKKEIYSSCCSGHVSIKGINELKLAPFIDLEKLTINRIRGANIFGPNGTNLEVRTKQYQTIVINRGELDKEIEKLAKNSGVEILCGYQVVAIDEDSIKVNIIDENRLINIDYNYLIGADGPNSIVRNSFSQKNNNDAFINTYQITATGNFKKDMVSVYFGDYAKNFFAWIIPEDTTTARIGIGTTFGYNPKEALNQFIFKQELKLSNIKFNCSGIIPISKPLDTYFYKNRLLIGDAACFVKATSGGGLVFGLKSAEIAAQTITDRFKKFQNVNNYNKNLKKYIYDLNLHYKIHNYIYNKTNYEFDELLKKLKEAGIEEFLNSFGNIDYPSKIIPNLIFYPKFIVFYKEFIRFVKS